MEIENFDRDQKKDVQELFLLFNMSESDATKMNNADELLEHLIKSQTFICIDEPQNEYEEVNLFDTVIQLFRKSGENLPEYFDEPDICDECEGDVIGTLMWLNEYYNLEEEKTIMILDNVRDKYIVCVVPESQSDKVYVLSFQTGIPLVDIEDY